MNTLREAAQQALEALEFVTVDFFMLDPICPGRESTIKAIVALRAALKEPVQEPVAWQWLDTAHFRKKIPADATPSHWRPLYTAPLQREENNDE